jgi:hypothetical protein
MKVVSNDGKHYLVGTMAEVGRTLTKRAKKDAPIDLGWSLSKQSDMASSLTNDTYRCEDCNYDGCDASFVGGECPECRSKNASKI